MPEPLIKLDNVWKTYTIGSTRIDALRGISLKIYEKETVAIMGPSGSGKSTLLNAVGALDTPTQGSILLKGKDLTQIKIFNEIFIH